MKESTQKKEERRPKTRQDVLDATAATSSACCLRLAVAGAADAMFECLSPYSHKKKRLETEEETRKRRCARGARRVASTKRDVKASVEVERLQTSPTTSECDEILNGKAGVTEGSEEEDKLNRFKKDARGKADSVTERQRREARERGTETASVQTEWQGVASLFVPFSRDM